MKETNNVSNCVSSINESTELRKDPHSQSTHNGAEEQLLSEDGTCIMTQKGIRGCWVHKGCGGTGYTNTHTNNQIASTSIV